VAAGRPQLRQQLAAEVGAFDASHAIPMDCLSGDLQGGQWRLDIRHQTVESDTDEGGWCVAWGQWLVGGA